jgi:hypothetical protein
MRMILTLLAWLALATTAPAQVPLTGGGCGVGTSCGGSPPAYTGPGDIVAATAWWGLRAYSNANAMAGSKAVQVCLTNDISCTDLVVNSSGNLVVTTIGGSSCGVVACFVKILYDQSGNTNCSGNACNLQQGNQANEPSFILNCISTFPCIKYLPSAGFQYALNTANTFTPNTSSGSTWTTYTSVDAAPSSTITPIACQSPNFTQVGIGPSSGNKAFAYTNSGFLYSSGALSLSTFYALIAVINNTSSVIDVSGTATTGTTAAPTNCSGVALGGGGLGSVGANMFVTEVGMYNSVLNSSQYGNLTTNMTGYW